MNTKNEKHAEIDNADTEHEVEYIKGANLSIPCSFALSKFYHTHNSIFDFFFFTIDLATNSDKMFETATKTLAETARSEEEKIKYESKLSKAGFTFKRLQKFAKLQSSNITLSVADNFLSYLSEIIQSVMLKCPDVLKSSDMIKVSEILQFNKYSDIKSYLVNKKINELSYGGISEIEKYVYARFGLNIFANDMEKYILAVLVESRNILSHNRGVINDMFIKRVEKNANDIDINLGGRFNFVVGNHIHHDLDQIAVLSNNSVSIAKRMDELLTKKYRIPKKKFNAWLDGENHK